MNAVVPLYSEAQVIINQDLRITPLSPPASGGKSLHAMFSELPPVDGGTEGGNA